MLRLESITKDYKVADSVVKALKGVSLSFRKNEFVSILGPSGCGKTTLLNIIGGLDKYTDGELFIGGVSTKNFTDADWDVYRNHRVGFIFQSYNLIPHQTVLKNVELALTIAGLSKQERVEKAKSALDRVGLSGEYNKRPNQLSGGQCQRVAIARALVNEPEILLADEPTGALDTVTSVQIMDLIKEIARERLVIMVTHNPELAEKYSTRIIRLLDGLVEGDSMPYSSEDEIADTNAENERTEMEEERAYREEVAKNPDKKIKKKKKQRAKMSLFTAFRLSAQNLFSKKRRTTMVSFAGAIGIIGVSLVLAVSSGVKGFIANMQNDMLSANPIKVEQNAFDMASLMTSVEPAEITKKALKDGYINVNELTANLIKQSDVAESLQVKNEITQDYVDYVEAMPQADVASINLNYGLDVSNNIYTEFTEGDEVARSMSLSAIRTKYIEMLKEKSSLEEYSAFIATIVKNFQQAPIDEDYILKQYDILGDGKIAKEWNEVMIVVDSNTEITDIMLAQLGYYTQNEFLNSVRGGMEDTNQSLEGEYDPSKDKMRFSYEELMGKRFTYYPNDSVYTMRSVSQELSEGHYNHLESEITAGNGVDLKIVGILRPKKNISMGSMEAGFFYTRAFAEKFIEDNKNSDLAKKMLATGTSTISSGIATVPIVDPNTHKPIIDPVTGESMKTEVPVGITYKYTFNYDGVESEEKTGFVGTPSFMGAFMSLIPGMGDVFGGMADMSTLSFQQIGGNVLPESIAVYPTDFETKDRVLAYLDKWNSDEDIVVGDKTITKDQREKVIYSDTLSLIIDMINSFIEIITIALICFTSLSLVVSTVMIAIITYVSVVERTKEIGVIRSLGGRKKDVSRLFTAETVIIGLASGLLGIGVTYLLSLVINAIVASASGMISAICALPLYQAGIMVAVSVVLTLISGVFPARAAARKDPVVALRTE